MLFTELVTNNCNFI